MLFREAKYSVCAGSNFATNCATMAMTPLLSCGKNNGTTNMRTSSSSSNLLGFAQSASLMDPADSLLPFTVEGVLVGWVKRSFAPHLENWPEHFTIRPRGVGMLGHFETAEHRSAALNEVVEALASGGVIHGWRNETVTVAESFYAEPLFHIERAASRYFGLTMYASHLNGLTMRNGALHVWIATRANSKEIDPSRLDNMAAGRIARGYTPLQTLIKEAGEEAGLSVEMAISAQAVGAVRCKYLVEEGLHQEIMFVHDVMLPADFTPKNKDGEVAGFKCYSMADVLTMLDEPAQFTVDAALVVIDCLIRHGQIGSDRDDYLELIHAIRP